MNVSLKATNVNDEDERKEGVKRKKMKLTKESIFKKGNKKQQLKVSFMHVIYPLCSEILIFIKIKSLSIRRYRRQSESAYIFIGQSA